MLGIHARNMIRSGIRICIECVKYRAQTVPQNMGDLLAKQVLLSQTFSEVKVDYASSFAARALPGGGRAARKKLLYLFV